MSDEAKRAAAALRTVSGLCFESEGIGYERASRNKRRLEGAIEAALAVLDAQAAETARADRAERLCVALAGIMASSVGDDYTDADLDDRCPAGWREQVAAMRTNQERKT